MDAKREGATRPPSRRHMPARAPPTAPASPESQRAPLPRESFTTRTSTAWPCTVQITLRSPNSQALLGTKITQSAGVYNSNISSTTNSRCHPASPKALAPSQPRGARPRLEEPTRSSGRTSWLFTPPCPRPTRSRATPCLRDKTYLSCSSKT